jgi:hypothetical protein
MIGEVFRHVVPLEIGVELLLLLLDVLVQHQREGLGLEDAELQDLSRMHHHRTLIRETNKNEQCASIGLPD